MSRITARAAMFVGAIGPISTHIEFLLAELLPVAMPPAADKVLASVRRPLSGAKEAGDASVPPQTVPPLPRVAQER